MQTHDLAPMSGGSDHRTEVICIEAKRICDFCFQEERIERSFDIPGSDGVHGGVTCEIDHQHIRCREVERRAIEGKKGRSLVCLAIEVPVRIRVGERVMNEVLLFLKQAILCIPEGTDVECQVTGNCCSFFDRTSGKLSTVFDLCVVIQSKVTIRALVPTYGLCAARPCQGVSTGCPPRLPIELCEQCEEKREQKDC